MFRRADTEPPLDFTAAAIIDNFQTESTQVSVEKVMKKLATEKAQVAMATRGPRLPSATFIKAYLEAFRERKSRKFRCLELLTESSFAPM